jgi:hypothetical protein
MKEQSDFGKGFIYNLILFSFHIERKIVTDRDKVNYLLWFYSASDHLIELEIPKRFKGSEIGAKASKLKTIALAMGHGDRINDKEAKEAFTYCVNLVKDIGYLLDKELGLKPIKGEWE